MSLRQDGGPKNIHSIILMQTKPPLAAGVHKSYILNIQDIRQLSFRLDNLRLTKQQKAQHTKQLDNIPNIRQSL